MSDVPSVMSGWHLVGHGGPDKLVWRDDIPVPQPAPGEVLIRVLASSVNNTDINTRVGWYAKSVRGATDGADSGGDDGGWGGALAFPLIQGIDCAGRIVAVGDDVDPARVGERVITRAMYRPEGGGPFDLEATGSERDGAFADYMTARADNALTVRNDDIPTEALGVLPCAFSTAYAMLERIELRDEKVLITGASGGVGLAAVQLARLRGADVVAVSSGDKADAVAAAGAQTVLKRDDALPDDLDVVVDLVAGPRWGDLINGLKSGGRYVTSGAIAGPIVELDVRDLYLKDLTLKGSTAQPDYIMPDLLTLVETGKLTPIIAERYKLTDLHAAQKAFEAKTHVGKIALSVSDD